MGLGDDTGRLFVPFDLAWYAGPLTGSRVLYQPGVTATTSLPHLGPNQSGPAALGIDGPAKASPVTESPFEQSLLWPRCCFVYGGRLGGHLG